MEFEFIVKVLASVVIAVLGWVVAHWFTSRRDISNKRREISTNYLIDAYRKIDSAIEPVEFDRKWCESLQSAVAEIQLFGSAKQIEMAHQFSELLLSEEKINQNILKSLLHDLRSELRNELGLENTDTTIGHIRIHGKST